MRHVTDKPAQWNRRWWMWARKGKLGTERLNFCRLGQLSSSFSRKTISCALERSKLTDSILKSWNITVNSGISSYSDDNTCKKQSRHPIYNINAYSRKFCVYFTFSTLLLLAPESRLHCLGRCIWRPIKQSIATKKLGDINCTVSSRLNALSFQEERFSCFCLGCLLHMIFFLKNAGELYFVSLRST